MSSILKKAWMELSDSAFATLTFGELKVGQRFISLPQPGDNSGHGGLRGAHYLFEKTIQSVTHAAPGLPYAIPHGRAVNLKRDLSTDMPDALPVILVE